MAKYIDYRVSKQYAPSLCFGEGYGKDRSNSNFARRKHLKPDEVFVMMPLCGPKTKIVAVDTMRDSA